MVTWVREMHHGMPHLGAAAQLEQRREMRDLCAPCGREGEVEGFMRRVCTTWRELLCFFIYALRE